MCAMKRTRENTEQTSLKRTKNDKSFEFAQLLITNTVESYQEALVLGKSNILITGNIDGNDARFLPRYNTAYIQNRPFRPLLIVFCHNITQFNARSGSILPIKWVGEQEKSLTTNLLKILLESGSDIYLNTPDPENNKFTPLMYASYSYTPHLLTAMLNVSCAHNIDFEAVDPMFNRTALVHAIREHPLIAVEMIKTRYDKFNIIFRGEGYIEYAVRYKHSGVLNALLDRLYQLCLDFYEYDIFVQAQIEKVGCIRLSRELIPIILVLNSFEKKIKSYKTSVKTIVSDALASCLQPVLLDIVFVY